MISQNCSRAASRFFDDSQGENVEIREVIRFFEALSLSHKISRLASRVLLQAVRCRLAKPKNQYYVSENCLGREPPPGFSDVTSDPAPAGRGSRSGGRKTCHRAPDPS